MSSNYLDQSHTIEELDAIIENGRIFDALIAKAIIEKDSIQVISQIDVICEVSMVRISSESEIAIANITAKAEISGARLEAQSSITESEIVHLGKTCSENKDFEYALSMISEISFLQTSAIAEEAKDAVSQIQTETTSAIDNLKEQTVKTLAEIEELKNLAEQKLLVSEDLACAKLEIFKRGKRTANDTNSLAETAAELILTSARAARVESSATKEAAVNRINTFADTAHSRLKKSCDEAVKKITAAWDSSVAKVKSTTDAALIKFR